MEKQMTKEEIAAAKSVAKTLRISRRSILYLIRTILLTLLVVLICAAAFLTASYISNTYILISEGMTLRAASMLQGGDDPDLAIYFTGDCIRDDAQLRAQSIAQFADYTISDYEYALTIEKLHVLPWQSDKYVDVIEQITSITATPTADAAPSAAPVWTPIRYRLHLQRIDTRWYVYQIELIELNPDLPAANTPDPARSPIPMATPTPEPTALAYQVP